MDEHWSVSVNVPNANAVTYPDLSGAIRTALTMAGSVTEIVLRAPNGATFVIRQLESEDEPDAPLFPDAAPGADNPQRPVAIINLKADSLDVVRESTGVTLFSEYIPDGLRGADLYEWAAERLHAAQWRVAGPWSDLGLGRYAAAVKRIEWRDNGSGSGYAPGGSQ